MAAMLRAEILLIRQHLVSIRCGLFEFAEVGCSPEVDEADAAKGEQHDGGDAGPDSDQKPAVPFFARGFFLRISAGRRLDFRDAQDSLAARAASFPAGVLGGGAE